MATAITGAPTAQATNLAWSRSGKTLTLTWELTDSNATSDSNPNRVEYIQINPASYYNSAGTYIGRAAMINNHASKDTRSCSFDLDAEGWFIGGHTYREIAYLKSGSIVLRNSAGYSQGVYLPTLMFSNPEKPTANDIEYDYSTGKVTFTLTGNEAIMQRPRVTYHMNVVRMARIGGVLQDKTTALNLDCLGWDSNTEQYTYSKELTESANLKTEDDFIYYAFTASVKGLLSCELWNIKTMYIAYPAKPTITGFTKVSSGGNVLVNSNYSEKRPTETMQLQIQYANRIENLTEDGWSNVGEEYTYNIESLPLRDSDVKNTVGLHVYLRVLATAQGRTIPSNIWLVDDRYYYWSENYYESEDTSVIQIVKVEQGEDSESLEVTIGYANNADYDACLLSYSTDRRAWTSTKQPETYEMPDSRWQNKTSQSSKHAYSSQITVLGLDADTTYYLRARRYKTTDDTKNTRYSEQASCNTSQEELTGLTLTAGDIVATGKECAFSWSFPDGLTQASWTLKDASTNAGLVCGNGSTTLTTCTFDTSGTKSVCLEAKFTDGRSMTSDVVNISVVDAPSLAFTTKPVSIVKALPQTFKITASDATADIQVKVLCESGIRAVKPDGESEQYASDVVYSAQGAGSVSCSITDGSKLWNNGHYVIQATATANGVKSDTLIYRFSVAYSATVATPTAGDVTITTNNKTATITIQNLKSGITWDLYRATVDGRNALIADGLASSATVTDNYAPYSTDGACNYIVMVRNSQQQYAFASYDYRAKCSVLRFDWNGNSVELPYNVEISDETDKQFEQQVYLDGTQRGSWGASVIRSATLSTDTVYIKDEATQKKVRELARYQGAVFIRTPLGQAYCANVNVKDISKDYNSNVMAVSFDCTEIDLTTEFKAQNNTATEEG